MMLLALKLIVAASLPMRESLIIQQIFVALGEDLVLAVIFGAIIAWASHSSLATVLLIITLASTNAVDTTVAFTFVLGANIGGAIPPMIATLGANRAARQPPLGNLMFRIIGVVVTLPFISVIAAQMSQLDSRQCAPDRQFSHVVQPRPDDRVFSTHRSNGETHRRHAARRRYQQRPDGAARPGSQRLRNTAGGPVKCRARSVAHG